MLQAKTQDIIPESGLGPQNSQWRRWVETSITNLKLSLKAFRADIANSFKAVSSSMELLSRQVGGLDDAVDDINDLIGSTISVATNTNTVSNYALDPIDSIKVDITFVVPSGYTKALVLASANSRGYNTNSFYAADDNFLVDLSVDGTLGFRAISNVPYNKPGSVSTQFNRLLSGLSTGYSFKIEASTGSTSYHHPANVDNKCEVSALVLFLR